ncbi:MAG: hypothetical protein JJ896_08560 [Rhodothermales bacterium]|nr:hypothetical protein [Rhodothermales bacterium]MBO6779690.1 hypothetical protein [Rhodothermales bacterium]
MSRWYQVFDDERVNVVTRVAARRHAAGAACLGVLTGIGVFAVVTGAVSLLPIAVVLIGLWGWAGSALLRQWSTLRAQVWCVKFSDREVVGYDYRRRRIRIDWVDARCVDVGKAGLAVTSVSDLKLEVPVSFPDYTELCHAILEHAEFYEIPVFVDGRRLSEMSASTLFPFLAEFQKPAR